MNVPTIFSRFLKVLGVPHTRWYSDHAFQTMTFKSLYGLAHLLSSYHVECQGLRLTDKAEITRLPLPFLAQTKAGIFVIVTKIAAGMVDYDSRGENLHVDLKDFQDAWNGIALVASPTAQSSEPDYPSHRITEIVQGLSKYALAISGLAIFFYFFFSHGLFTHLSTILLTLFNCIGLYFSYLLVQKSLNIHTEMSDHVCSVLEKGGCDSIMELKVSKLFGVFSWSEIGLTYFGISLIVLLLYPHLWPSLAVCNICCLPYTFWSIWYQKFRAKHWCTLCVGVQSTLWCLFFCYLCGGWLGRAFPLHFNFVVLVAVYIFTVLLLNIILKVLANLPCHEKAR